MRTGTTIQLATLTVAVIAADAQAELRNRYSFSGDANDSIGGKNGTLIGQATISNGALNLNGTTSTYLSLPGGLLPTGANDAVTVETWLSTGVNGPWARIFDFGVQSGSNGGDAFFLAAISSTNDARLRVNDGIPGYNNDQGVVVTGPVLVQQPLMHVAAVYDASIDSMKLYRNGVLIGSATVDINPDQLNNVVSFIGKSLYVGDSYLNASMTEFRIYNHALSATKVAENYAAGADAVVTRWSGGSGAWNTAAKWDTLTAPRSDWDLKVDAGVVSVATPLTAKSLTIGSGGTVDLTATLNATITNAGKITGAGVMSIAGGYTQSSTGELVLEIGGETEGAGYDSFHIAGAAVLGGKLTVVLANGFTPAVGQTFNLLDFLSATGSFGSISTPYFVGGKFDTKQLYSDGTVTVVAPEPAGIAWIGVVGLAALRRNYKELRLVSPSAPAAGRASSHR
jgi:hypothetical protein